MSVDPRPTYSTPAPVAVWHDIPKAELAKPVRKQLKQLRKARRAARADARSGNPAKRAAALRAVAAATAVITGIYRREASR